MIIGPVLALASYFIFSNGLGDGDTTKADKKAKALSVFTVVKFPNTVCSSSTSGRNGTCYTNSECAAKGGSSSGSCASSFGVCCVFEKTCGGGTVAENCTYFTSTSRTLGSSCSLKICKCSDDVCQLRLDFETFAINNPVTVSTVTHGPTTSAAGTANSMGQCQVDSFQVTTCGGKAPPLICGTNTGEHMYVPACSASTCNTLNANFGSSSGASTTAFTIKVTQIPCNSKTAAPNGCLQYFTGTTGTINTYNYNSGAGTLLFDQDYSACIRAERTICSICYYAAAGTFSVSVPGGIASWGTTGVDTACGIPGFTSTTLVNGGAFDHILIPDGQCNSPLSNAIPADVFEVDRYCGTSFICSTALGITAAATAATRTVCSMNRPFKISIQSDGVEYIHPAAAGEGLLANNRGFTLGYFMQTSCLTRPTAT